MKARLSLTSILLALAPAAHAATDATPTTIPLISATGKVDNTPVSCSPISVGIRKVAAGLELVLDCGGPALVSCIVLPGEFRLANRSLTFACLSSSTTGAFRAMHLPQVSTVAPSGSATLQVQVYNSTPNALINLAVNASAVPGCSAARASLAAGAVWQYNCAASDVTSDLSNILTVTAKTATGSTLVASAKAQVVVDGPRLSLDVSPRLQRIYAPGGPAQWSVLVANQGNTTMTNVLAADDIAGSSCFIGPIAALAPGNALSYACQKTAVSASFTALHTAQASAGGRGLIATQQAQVVYGDAIFKSGFEQASIFADGFERSSTLGGEVDL